MRYLSWMLIISSLQLCAQRPLVPYNDKGMWGFADTSGTIVVKPFSWYKLSPLTWGLSLVSAGENKKGIVDTNANFVLPMEFYDCKFNTVGIEAIKLRYFQAKDGLYKEFWHHVYNKKGMPIPIGAVLYVEFLSDTNFILTKREDSTFFYRVSWQNAQSKLVFGFKTQTTVYYQFKEENSSSLHYIMNYNPHGKTEYYWPDGRMIAEEEIAGLGIKARRTQDSLRRRRENLYATYQSLIIRKKGKYSLRSTKFSKVFDKIKPIYVQEDISPVFNFMMAKKGKIWRVIDTFGHEKCKIRCDYMAPVYAHKSNRFTGLFRVRKSGKWGLCDTLGIFLLELKYETLKLAFTENEHNFSTGGILLKSKGKWGFSDGSGRILLDLKYDKIEPEPNQNYGNNDDYFTGTLKVKLGDKFGLADSLGNMLLYPAYDLIEMQYMPRNNRIWLCKKEGKYTIYNAAEKQFIGNVYDSVIYITKKYIIVKKGNLWGVINLLGDIEIDFQIDEFPRDEVDVLVAGNDICLLGGINGEKYLFSNIRNYKKVKIVNHSRWKADWPNWLQLGDTFLRILNTNLHIVITSEKNKEGYKTGEHINIAGMEYYFYKLNGIIEGYIREDGNVFFER